MTAVAPPLTFQPSTRLGWTSNGNGFGAMNSDEVSRMFTPAPRKTVQRQNSSSSIASTNSTSSSATTIEASAPQTNGVTSTPVEANSWAARKKPARGLWPPSKAEPATGISAARPQTVASAASGPSAASAISALHAPVLQSQQMSNGSGQANGVRTQPPSETQPLLHLVPMNNTFDRKTISVPVWPDVIRIGRQTNGKTVPTPLNGYFDSKVLSRSHAEVHADRQGRIWIRDIKSSNGTFVNGRRLSQENKESEPQELREQDVLELGIDIVSEDQKTVVHHKVAAKVEHAGAYPPGNEGLNFGELDPNASTGLVAPMNQLRRTGSQGALAGRGTLNPGANASAAVVGGMNYPPSMRNWLAPHSTENIVKRLNAELKFAMQQSEDMARARQHLEALLSGSAEVPMKDSSKSSSDRSSRPSLNKSKADLRAHFSEPPAPPPSAPLPEKPDVAKALADPLIQPLLRRSDTAKQPTASSSPTRADHSNDILRLCEELKLAKGELSNQRERMKSLENELAHERTARESAEERAQRLERTERRDSPRSESHTSSTSGESTNRDAADIFEGSPELQVQLDRLRASMDEMKQQMELYRQRAEIAETERDSARQSLVEMIEMKRREASSRSPRHSPTVISPTLPSQALNGHAISPTSPKNPTTSEDLLSAASVQEGQPITPKQAKILTRILQTEVLIDSAGDLATSEEGTITYHGRPLVSAAAVVLLGVIMMGWMNGWVPPPPPRLER